MDSYPENSWLGLQAAIDVGARWLEFDIQMCADGQFILIHDSDFKRTSDTSGSVFEITTEEIQRISVHEPRRFGNKFYPLHISTLDDVLTRLSDYPQVSYMVEIKVESLEHWGIDAVMERLIDIIRPYRNNSVLISFSYDAMDYAKVNSDIRIGLVLNRYDQYHKECAVSLTPDYLICNHKKLTKNRPLWDGPWEWMLYEINSPLEAMEFGAHGIKYIETGEIGAMLKGLTQINKARTHAV